MTLSDTVSLHGGVKEAFNCCELEVLSEGPAGTGKTFADCLKAIMVAEKYPGSRQLLARKTRASMTESILVTFEAILGPGHPMIVNGPSRAHRHSYDFPNGSTIVVGGMDQPTRCLSTEWDRIYLFEAIEFNQNETEILLTRCRHSATAYNQIVYETNPGVPAHFLNRLANEGRLTRKVTRHRDNPKYWDHGKNEPTPEGVKYLALLDRLTGHRRARLRDGKWAASEGLVYPEFDIAIHGINEMPKGWQHWTKYRAIDFGYVDPFICQWWAVNGGVSYLYREIYHSGRIIEDHARQIKALSGDESYECTVSDHDREDRETLHRHGVETVPAVKDIDLGMNEFRARLLPSGNGKPRIRILRGCTVEIDPVLAEAHRPTSTQDEFDCHKWKQRGGVTATGVPKDEPVDADNHGLDAGRYHVMGLVETGFYVGTARGW